jgi:outer membrane protein OmpA-like peptidoglycan-associated protein
MGAQGASVGGPMGPMGRSGPAGEQGRVGETGVRGATLVGPAGPQGSSGGAGAQGATGWTGKQGSTTAGAVGATGRSGPAGVQGPVGSIGGQGATGVVDRWTSFRDFMFDYDRADVQSADATKVAEIAAYMKQNPSLQVGIDGSMDPRGTDPRDQKLSDRRVDAVRTALIGAGVPAYKIKTGAFGDTGLTKDRRVEVLISTSR